MVSKRVVREICYLVEIIIFRKLKVVYMPTKMCQMRQLTVSLF